MDVNQLIGYELRTQRLIKRLTIQAVANSLDKSINTISYYELGKIKITVKDLIDYCKAIDCDWLEVLQNVKRQLTKCGECTINGI